MRVAEVAVGVAVVVAQRRGRHAELHSGREVFENLAPGARVAGAAAVTLVDDDEVEEVRRERLEQADAPLILGQRLIEGEIHLAALDDLAGLDLIAGIAEGREDAVLGLVHEDVAVGEVEDFGPPIRPGAVPAGTPELPADVEGHHGLARPCGHGEEEAPPPLEDGFHGAVDGDLLVIALARADGVIGRREQAVGGLRIVEAAGRTVALPELGGCRVVQHGRFPARCCSRTR